METNNILNNTTPIHTEPSHSNTAGPLRRAFNRVLTGVLAVSLIACTLTGCQQAEPETTGQSTKATATTGAVAPATSEDLIEVIPEEASATSQDLVFSDSETSASPNSSLPSGSCGERLTWAFDSTTGTLRIDGSGDMADFAEAKDVPWYSYQKDITQIDFSSEVTGIGNNAFNGCTALQSLLFPNGLTRIGDYAFAGCVYCPMDTYYFSNTLTEIGKGAFQGDYTNMEVIVCPESLTKLGDDAFSQYTGWTTIWILNQDCAIGSHLGDSDKVTICGFPGSTAEQYASENGYTFDPIVENMEALVDQLGRDDLSAGETTHYRGVIPVGNRHLCQICHASRVCATEEEIQKAKESGTLVLDGKSYVFTDSEEEIKMLVGESAFEQRFSEDGIGWIFDPTVSKLNYYVVMQEGDHYQFHLPVWYEEDKYMQHYSAIGWIWMDSDSLFSNNGMLSTAGEDSYATVLKFKLRPCRLELNDEGKIVFCWASASKV